MNLRKTSALILSIFLLGFIINLPLIPIEASLGTVFTPAFKEASELSVVASYQGVTLLKKDFDQKTGRLTKEGSEKLKGIKKAEASLKEGYPSAILTKEVKGDSLEAYQVVMYLSPELSSRFANNLLLKKPYSDIGKDLIGSVPRAGYVSLLNYIKRVRVHELENELYALSDKEKGVELAFIKTNYLSFYLLKPWSDEKINRFTEASEAFNGRILKESYLAL